MQNMRQVHINRKKKRHLTSILLTLNVLLWGSGIYLWLQDYELAPTVARSLADEQAVEFPFIAPGIFNAEQMESYDEVGFEMYSHHALLINLTTGDILFAHHENERVYPASLTKIMTVLVGLEQASGEDLMVQADFDALFLANASMAHFEAGETRPLSDVLHGAMLPSGADATSTLAHHVAESYEGFVDLMNETAMRLGMFDTHFVNASGLHDDDHYTTAYDIALLLKYALGIEAFREVFTTSIYTTTTGAGDEHVMRSTMFDSMAAIGQSPGFNGGEILGGKDGFTFEAGLCLASLATDGEDEFMLITLQAPPSNEADVSSAHVVDAFTIYEYFFNLD